jgi:hypothetical protein
VKNIKTFMLNNYFFPAAPSSVPLNPDSLTGDSAMITSGKTSRWQIFTAAAFLVSVPVFIQAPLVRQFPLLTLVLTAAWVIGGWWLYQRPHSKIWGDLLLGFSWSWLAGTIYWGWLRTEPYWHLPVEAIGLPFGLWCLWVARRNKTEFLAIGTWFYFGSLWGTALTDGYFYVNSLIPYWRAVMAQEPALAAPILHQAIEQINNPLGWISAFILIFLLLATGLQPLKQSNLAYWAFSGAILSTILVDGLFWLVAAIA